MAGEPTWLAAVLSFTRPSTRCVSARPSPCIRRISTAGSSNDARGACAQRAGGLVKISRGARGGKIGGQGKQTHLFVSNRGVLPKHRTSTVHMLMPGCATTAAGHIADVHAERIVPRREVSGVVRSRRALDAAQVLLHGRRPRLVQLQRGRLAILAPLLLCVGREVCRREVRGKRLWVLRSPRGGVTG